MTDEQKVFIRGVEGRGAEVRQALTNLGGKNVHDFCYGDTEGLFFINHYGEIRYTSEFSEMGKIIMDNYTELHLPEKWKDGDILVHTDDDGFIVYSVYKETKGFNEYTRLYSIRTYVSVDIYMYGINMVWDWDKDKCKLASDEESKQFHELLHKYGTEWDAEKKQLVDWKWKPKDGDTVYYFDEIGQILSDRFDDFSNGPLLDFGNCFQTKEEAEAAAERVRKVLKGE